MCFAGSRCESHLSFVDALWFVDTVSGHRGPFLEIPGNLTGPKSYFEIKVSRKVGCVLTSNKSLIVSFADNFHRTTFKRFETPIWNGKQNILTGPVIIESFEKRAPRRGLFLESPGNLTGPKSYFEIKVSRKVGCVLTSNEVHFVSLADTFTA